MHAGGSVDAPGLAVKKIKLGPKKKKSTLTRPGLNASLKPAHLTEVGNFTFSPK